MRLLCSFAAAAAMLVAPITAHAVTGSAKTVTYHTAYRQTRPLPSGGEVTGVMRLTFAPDGSVSGTYREEFAGGTQTVAGGLTGSSIWLSFGARGRHQLQGVLEKNGTISGTLSNWRGPRVFQFTAVPAKS
jgi:hypothetical protein